MPMIASAFARSVERNDTQTIRQNVKQQRTQKLIAKINEVVKKI